MPGRTMTENRADSPGTVPVPCADRVAAVGGGTGGTVPGGNGGVARRTIYLAMFGFSWIFVYARWKRVPRAGVRWALATGPTMLAGMWVVGVLSEIRIFGELTALMTVALTLLLRREFGWGEGGRSE